MLGLLFLFLFAVVQSVIIAYATIDQLAKAEVLDPKNEKIAGFYEKVGKLVNPALGPLAKAKANFKGFDLSALILVLIVELIAIIFFMVLASI